MGRGELADNETRDVELDTQQKVLSRLRTAIKDQPSSTDRLIYLPLFVLPVNQNNFCLPFVHL